MPWNPKHTRELSCRESDGVTVRLLWDKSSKEIYVTYNDSRRGEDYILNPPNFAALDAFYHPNYYAQQMLYGKPYMMAMESRKAAA